MAVKVLECKTPLMSIFTRASLVAILLLIVTAAAATSDATRQTELRLVVPQPGTPSREIYDRFLDQNPDITFAPAGGISIEGTGQDASFYMAMAGGTAADVIYSPLETVGTYYDQGFLLPIDAVASPNDPLLASIRDFVKPIIAPEGRYYAVPMFYKAHGFAFRKDLFLEAGLPLRAPLDWDEWFEFALALHDPEAGVVGYAVYGGTWLYSHILWQAGGEYLTYGGVHAKSGHFTPSPPGSRQLPERCEKNGLPFESGRDRVTIRSTFHHREGQQAVNFLRRLLFCQWARDASGSKMLFRDVDLETGSFIDHAKVVSPTSGSVYRTTDDGTHVTDGSHHSKLHTGVAIAPLGRAYKVEVYQRFEKKRLGMMILSSAGGRDGRLPDHNPAVVGLGPMPVGPLGKPVTIANSGCWCINSQIAPEKRQAAWRFIQFMCGDEARKLKVKAMVERGQAAFVLPKHLELAGYPQYIEDVPKDWVAANRELVKSARSVPNDPGWRMVSPKIGEMLETMYTQENIDVRSVMAQRAAECDRVFLGQLGDSAARKLRPAVKWGAAIIIFLVSAGMLLITFRFTLQTLQNDSETTEPKRKRRVGWRRRLYPLLFMFPALAVITVFHYLPLVRGSYMALFDYRIIGDSVFVGIDNFLEAILSPDFWWSMYITFKYMFVSLAIGFGLPILVALLLDEIPWGRYFFRTVYYLPAVTSALIIMLMWKEFYDPTPAGMLNTLFGYLGLGPFQFLRNPNVALLCVVIPGAWAHAGPGSILYLAALKVVPTELYEAAAIDGASWHHKLRFVTLPILFPLILINFIGAFLGAMQGMDNILVMTGGGPDRETHVIGLEIFFQAYVYLRFGYAIAVAWILGAVLLAFTALKIRIMKRVDFKAAEDN